MFIFKDIETWDAKKLNTTKWIFNAIYFIATLIAPIIIVMINYSLFESVKAHIKITGVGIIVLIIVIVWGYKKINEVVNSLPDASYKERSLKFFLKWVFSAIPLIVMIIALALVKDELTRAYNTLYACICCFAISSTIKHLFMDFLTAEISLRNDTLKDKEKLKRRNLV